MFQVFLQRKVSTHETEEILVGKTEDPFSFILDPLIFEEIDPSWEHSSIPIRVVYKRA